MTQIGLFCKWGALALSFFFLSCSSYVTLSGAVQENVNQKLKQKTFWLKQSLYAGPFYDDDRYRLVHPRRFEDLTYLTTLDGDIILPPPSDGIIPFGTRVTIEKIEWPTGINIFRRPVFTPRHFPWIFLKVARDRGPVTLDREEPHVLLLSNQVVDEASLDIWMKEIFSTEDTNDWLFSRNQSIRAGILEKKAVTGMEYEDVIAALGHPDQIRRDLVKQNDENITREIATYGSVIVIMERGKVTRVDDTIR